MNETRHHVEDRGAFDRGRARALAAPEAIRRGLGAVADLFAELTWIPRSARMRAAREALTALGRFYLKRHGEVLASRDQRRELLRARMRKGVPVLLFLVACSGTENANQPPKAVINGPASEAVWLETDRIPFVGSVADGNGLADIQSVTWTSSIDGTLGTEELTALDDQGHSTFDWTLSKGSHTVTLAVTDFAGETGEDRVVVDVGLADASPEVSILSPENLDNVFQGGAFQLRGQATDPQYDRDELSYLWSIENQATNMVTDLDEGFLNAAGETEHNWTTQQIGSFKLRLDVSNPGHLSDYAEIVVIVSDPYDQDVDLDGQTPNQGDCDDGDASVNTNADEIADGKDNDCDNEVDEGTDLYDDDGDGYCESETVPCSDGAQNGDCNDSEVSINPGVPETANGLDDNCNSIKDEGTDLYDNDGDGYCANAGGCTDPISQPGDCNDAVDTIHPDATEVCGDNLDNNCNGTQNELNAANCTWYAKDEDGDNWGDTTISQCWCEPTGNYDILPPYDQDCLDTNPDVNPDATVPQSYQYWTGSAWSWDYNCDGYLTKSDNRTSIFTCCVGDTALGSCFGNDIFVCYYGSGWVSGPPACGTMGSWATSCTWPDCYPSGIQLVSQKCY